MLALGGVDVGKKEGVDARLVRRLARRGEDERDERGTVRFGPANRFLVTQPAPMPRSANGSTLAIRSLFGSASP